MSRTYNFSVLEHTFSFQETSHDLTKIDASQIFAMIRLSNRVTILSAISKDDCVEKVKWKCLRLEGEYDFTEYGILAEVSQVFARAHIPVMAFSDYRTDYFAVQEQHLAKAIGSLEFQGNTVISDKVNEFRL